MRALRLTSLGLVLALPVLASPYKPSPKAETHNKAFAAAMVKGDVAALADMYTEDGRLIFFDGKNYSGKAEIKAFFEGFLKENKVKSMTITSEDAAMMGGAIMDIGSYMMVTVGKDGKESASKGRYMEVLTKGKDGKWRLFRDCPLSN